MKKPTLAVVAIVAAALLASACEEDPQRPPVTESGSGSPGRAGGGSGDGSQDGGEGGAPDSGLDAATACTDLVPTGPIIDQNAINDDPSAGMGGTFVDGIYDLTDARLHQGAAGLPGPTGSSYQGAIRFTGTTFERVMVFQSSGGAKAETRTSGTFTLNGQNATFSAACPTPGQEQLTYSVANTSVTFSNLATKESFTFTLRP